MVKWFRIEEFRLCVISLLSDLLLPDTTPGDRHLVLKTFLMIQVEKTPVEISDYFGYFSRRNNLKKNGYGRRYKPQRQ